MQRLIDPTDVLGGINIYNHAYAHIMSNAEIFEKSGGLPKFENENNY